MNYSKNSTSYPTAWVWDKELEKTVRWINDSTYQVIDVTDITFKVNVKKLHEDAKLPTYGTDGAACFDLYALMESPEASAVLGGHSGVYSTGLSFEIPDGHVMLVFSRSGHGFKNGVRLANCVGVIDSDYRGELKVALHNDGEGTFHVQNGDRIAQAMVLPFPKVTFNEVEELSETSRGVNGFGSTGK